MKGLYNLLKTFSSNSFLNIASFSTNKINLASVSNLCIFRTLLGIRIPKSEQK